MLVVAEGVAGSGKTLLITRLAYTDYKKGATIYPNYEVIFDENDNVNRWQNIDELYNLTSGVILIDEAVRLMDARRWQSLPVGFTEKIATHRHDHLDIYTTTQSINHIDLRVRSNVHTLYTCRSILRFPPNDRVLPFFQWIKVKKKIRLLDETSRLKFKTIGKQNIFISRFWTKKLYNTYQKFIYNKYLCRVIYKDKKWRAKIYSRDLVNRGKARI